MLAGLSLNDRCLLSVRPTAPDFVPLVIPQLLLGTGSRNVSILSSCFALRFLEQSELCYNDLLRPHQEYYAVVKKFDVAKTVNAPFVTCDVGIVQTRRRGAARPVNARHEFFVAAN